MIKGIYEYCGIQRCGKSTLMVRDLVEKLLREFKADNVFANFRLLIPGVTALNNSGMLDAIMETKRKKARDRVFLFDEVGQELKARSYGNSAQTEVVSFAWQMPKRNIVLAYCSNVGNSADIILRDATWQTIMPRYHHAGRWEDDWITARVIFNYDCRVMRGVVVRDVHQYQRLFDSYEPIE